MPCFFPDPLPRGTGESSSSCLCLSPPPPRARAAIAFPLPSFLSVLRPLDQQNVVSDENAHVVGRL